MEFVTLLIRHKYKVLGDSCTRFKIYNNQLLVIIIIIVDVPITFKFYLFIEC